MATVFDYSFTRPDPAVLAEKGIGAVRYVPYRGDEGKGLTVAERDALHAAGLGIALVFESTAGRALDGAGAGLWDAGLIVDAREALSWPADRPTYIAVDRDVNASHYRAIREYFEAAAGVLGVANVGIYGEFEICREIAGAGLASWIWQCSAWSGSAVYPGYHLYQIGRLNGSSLGGGLVDYNDAPLADWGQWAIGEENGLRLSEAETEALLFSLFAGGERRDLTREQKLDIVRDRLANAETYQSVLDVAASAMVVAKAVGAGEIKPGITAAEVETIVNRELQQARLAPGEIDG